MCGEVARSDRYVRSTAVADVEGLDLAMPESPAAADDLYPLAVDSLDLAENPKV